MPSPAAPDTIAHAPSWGGKEEIAYKADDGG
jgi:hypothetical protein